MNLPINGLGTISALAACMATAQRFEELVAWQLSEELKEEIIQLLQRPKVARDVGFCDDIRRSARSAPANISEGFGWYEPKPNARHVSIAKASLEETRNHILEGFKRNHFDPAERDDLLNLHKRAVIATTRYLRYLRSCKHAPEGKPYKPRPDTAPTGDPRTQKPGTQAPKKQAHQNLKPENPEPENPERENRGNQNPGNPGNSGTREPS